MLAGCNVGKSWRDLRSGGVFRRPAHLLPPQFAGIWRVNNVKSRILNNRATQTTCSISDHNPVARVALLRDLDRHFPRLERIAHGPPHGRADPVADPSHHRISQADVDAACVRRCGTGRVALVAQERSWPDLKHGRGTEGPNGEGGLPVVLLPGGPQAAVLVAARVLFHEHYRVPRAP